MRKLIGWIVLGVTLLTPCPLAIPPKVVYNTNLPATYHCLTWVVWDESRGEPLKGSRAVLDVVLKRMKDSGKTACEVIAQAQQFSGYKSYYPMLVGKEALERFVRVARMPPVHPECKYFHAANVYPAWATKMTRCGRIGKHIFYKEKKHELSKNRSRTRNGSR